MATNPRDPSNPDDPSDRALGFHVVVPRAEDGRSAHAIASRLSGLDLDSPYTYLFAFDRFRSTCRLALSRDAVPIGFVTGLRNPTDPRSLLLWQIAVDPDHHRRGVGRALLDAFVRSEGGRDATRLETNLSPDDVAFAALLDGFARERGVVPERRPGFPVECFPTRNSRRELCVVPLR